MTGLRVWLARVAGVFGFHRTDADLSEEIRTHLDLLTEEQVRNGLSRAEARAVALRQFGGVEQIKARYRDQLSLPAIDALIQDIRFALRTFLRKPIFAGGVVLTFALGLGATTAVFSVIEGILLRPLPYPSPDRIVTLTEGYEGAVALKTGPLFSNVTYYAWTGAGFRFIEGIEAYAVGEATVSFDSGAEQIPAARLTPGMFRLLGARAAIGRLFLESESVAEQLAHTVVLSDRFWRSRFDGNPAVVGRTIRIGGETQTIVGVTEPGFFFPNRDVSVWQIYVVPRPTGSPQNPRFTTFFALARLKPLASTEQASLEGTAVVRRINPKPLAGRLTFGDGGPAFVRARTALNEMTAGIRVSLLVAAAGVGAILLIVCVNVANLLLARSAARGREFAVRSALGAGRMRLSRQLLTETLMLSASGGGLGILLAFSLLRLPTVMAPHDLPRLDGVRLDVPALTFAVLATMFAAVASSLAPMLNLTSTGRAAAFRGDGSTGGTTEGTHSERFRRVLLAAESALAVGLLVVTVLLAHSFMRLIQVDAGYSAESVLTATVYRAGTDQTSAQRLSGVMQAALERVRTTPGVVAAGIGSATPLDENWLLQAFPVPGSRSASELRTPGGPAPQTAFVRGYAITPGYEQALGLRLRAGRFFSQADRSPDAVRWLVNEEFVRLHFADNPVGHRFPWRQRNQDVELEIVGVVGNVLKSGNRDQPQPEMYSLLQDSDPFYNYQLVVRTSGNPMSLVPALRDILHDAAPDAAIKIVPLEDRVRESVAQPRLGIAAFAVMSALALTLTAVGLYASLSYTLSQRRREFGVRMAIGATRFDLVRLVVQRGMTPVLIGLFIGMGVSAGVARVMRTILFGVSPLDPVSFLTAPAVLVPVAVVACLLPAVRAGRVDPMTALRCE